MYYRGHMYKGICPYCGGMHPAAYCPMIYPPAIPAPPMPTMPMPPEYPPPVMPGMEQMKDMMMKHHKMLEEIHHDVKEIKKMVEVIYTKMAKG